MQPCRKLEIVSNLYRHIDYLEIHKLCTEALLKPAKVEHPMTLGPVAQSFPWPVRIEDREEPAWGISPIPGFYDMYPLVI